jgi:ribosomal protein S18 acetylase RimI-like enzyme
LTYDEHVLPESITLRPVEPADTAFLRDVYGSTRADELALTGWNAAEKDAFVQMQFDAQDHHYRATYSNASFQVILREGRPIGRLYVARGDDEIRIVDIAILPAYRGGGVGTALIAELLGEAQHAGKAVRIHVERDNPALRLYSRLGFRPIAERGVYWFLEWSPAAADQLNTAS